MSIDLSQILEDVKTAALPELEKRADALRTKFLAEVDEFVDSSRIGKLDELLKEIAEAEIRAVTATDKFTADQWATVADDKLRSVRLIVISEQIVASREIAAMLQAAAVAAWEGFKTVAAGMLNAAIKGALTGLLGPAGGVIADAASGFLGEAIEGVTDVDE